MSNVQARACDYIRDGNRNFPRPNSSNLQLYVPDFKKAIHQFCAHVGGKPVMDDGLQRRVLGMLIWNLLE